MAQFDVHRVKGGRLVVDCQSDLLDDLPTRFVVPLRAKDSSVIQHLTPIVRVAGREFIFYTPLAGSIDASNLTSTTFVESLLGDEYVIKSAIDILTTGV